MTRTVSATMPAIHSARNQRNLTVAIDGQVGLAHCQFPPPGPGTRGRGLGTVQKCSEAAVLRLTLSESWSAKTGCRVSPGLTKRGGHGVTGVGGGWVRSSTTRTEVQLHISTSLGGGVARRSWGMEMFGWVPFSLGGWYFRMELRNLRGRGGWGMATEANQRVGYYGGRVVLKALYGGDQHVTLP
eukprot:756488-Hanusia_phi.AAC.6